MNSASWTLETSAIPGSKSLHPLRTGEMLDYEIFDSIRRRAVLEGCKWDPQVGDVETLATFPLIMSEHEWNDLAAQAELLTAEAIEAELEIAERPELIDCLGLPSQLSKILADGSALTPEPCRIMRFDFHFTTEGWRISEANSDVPGGFSEGSYFTSLIGRENPELRMPGDPARRWAEVLSEATGDNGVVGLLSAPGFMEDHQVVAFLARQLRELGVRCYLAKPEQITWKNERAFIEAQYYTGPVDTIVRFYQAEWIARCSQALECKRLFRCGKTPVANSVLSVISESKRFPLTWPKLKTQLDTWKSLLPETRDPRTTPWFPADDWLLKTALCNTGDTVSLRSCMPKLEWLKVRVASLFESGRWILQRRFESVPISTPIGLRHVCVGVFTVNGKAAGAYVRMSEKPVIDFSAVDAALLIDPNG